MKIPAKFADPKALYKAYLAERKARREAEEIVKDLNAMLKTKRTNRGRNRGNGLIQTVNRDGQLTVTRARY